MLVDPMIGVMHELLLRLLQLVQEEHQDQGQQQRDERGVEGDTQALGHAADVAGHRFVSL